jgi:hypothetical protein
MKRIRVVLGVLGLVATSYLAFDPAHRLDLAWEKISSGGPYALAVLAVANLTRAAVRSASIYLGPALLTLPVLLLLFTPALNLSDVLDVLLIVVLVAAAMLVLSAFPEGGTWTRIMWTGRAKGPPKVAGEIRAVVVLGEIRLDLLDCAIEGRTVLIAVVLGGRVVVDLPREWRVVARPPNRLLLAVREHGRRDQIPVGRPDMEVRLLGMGGALELRRS